MIIKTNLNDLRDVTHYIHYENYRYKKLTSFNTNQIKNGKTLQNISIDKLVYNIFFIFYFYFYFYRNLLSQLEDEKMEIEQKLDKMSQDMENVYQNKVQEKLIKLQENKQNVKSIFYFYYLFSFFSFSF